MSRWGSVHGLVLSLALLGAAPRVAYGRLVIPAPGPEGPAERSLKLAADLRRACSELLGTELSAALKGAEGKAFPSLAKDKPAAGQRLLTTQPDPVGGVVVGLQGVCGQLASGSLDGLDSKSVGLLRWLHDVPSREWLRTAVSLAATQPGKTTWAEVFEKSGPDGRLQGGAAALAGLSSLLPIEAQTKLLNGLSEFLADRARLELTLWLQERLAAMCDDEVELGGKEQEVSELAPSLCSVFEATERSPVSLPALGRRLRAAAQGDLEALPDALLGGLEVLPGGDAPDLVVLRTLLGYASAVGDGRDPVAVLAGLESVADGAPPKTGEGGGAAGSGGGVPAGRSGLAEVQALGQTVGHVVARLDETGGTDGFDLVALAVAATKGQSAEEPAKALEKAVGALQRRLPGVKKTVNRLREEIDRLRSSKEDPLVHVLQMVETGLDLLQEQLPMSGAARTLLVDLRVVLERLSLKDYAAALDALLRALPEELELPPKLHGLLSLASELASAESSEEVAAVLEAAAAPAGGWRDKYRQRVISLTAFVGGAVAYDSVTVEAKGFGDATSADVAFQPTALVGLQASWPVCSKLHVGGYFSVLDLGNSVSSRLENEAATEEVEGEGQTAEVEAKAQLGLAQVLSPGLFLTLGMAATPITLGLGAAYKPGLREVRVTKEAGGEEVSKTAAGAFQVEAFLALDLALLPF